MDSTKKKTAIIVIKKVAVLFWRLENLTDRMILVISQDRLSGGTHENRKTRRVNPESIRLNPNSKSNSAPTTRINGNWVKKIDMALN